MEKLCKTNLMLIMGDLLSIHHLSSEFSVKVYQNFSNFTFCFCTMLSTINPFSVQYVINTRFADSMHCFVLELWQFSRIACSSSLSVLQTLSRQSSFVDKRQITHGKGRSTQIYSLYPNSIFRGRVIKLMRWCEDLTWGLLYPISFVPPFLFSAQVRFSGQ